MDGGPSQVDTFDPKPRLTTENGQPFKMKMEPTQFNNNGNTLGSPLEVRPARPERHAGQRSVSARRPARRRSGHRPLDDVEFSEHTSANYFLHTGTGPAGPAEHGGLVQLWPGSECENLPGFVVLNGGLIPPGGLDNFSSGFSAGHVPGLDLPARANRRSPTSGRREADAPACRRTSWRCCASSTRPVLERLGRVDPLESAIANYELAFRMQIGVPELVDFAGETPATLAAYGLDAEFAADARFSPGSACSRGGWSSAACGSSS